MGERQNATLSQFGASTREAGIRSGGAQAFISLVFCLLFWLFESVPKCFPGSLGFRGFGVAPVILGPGRSEFVFGRDRQNATLSHSCAANLI